MKHRGEAIVRRRLRDMIDSLDCADCIRVRDVFARSRHFQAVIENTATGKTDKLTFSLSPGHHPNHVNYRAITRLAGR